MSDAQDMADPPHGPDCPTDEAAHIAWIEAGYTLAKWWKAGDPKAKEQENEGEVRKMLARWQAHGIVVASDSLDAAWPEAEAALPEGWTLEIRQVREFRVLRPYNVVTGQPGETIEALIGYSATATNLRTPDDGSMGGGQYQTVGAMADTPVAALRALVAKLRERA